MQSFLQYRNFGRLVKEERGRHRCHPDEQQRHYAHDSSSTSLSSSSGNDETKSKRDLAKADPEKGEPRHDDSPDGEASSCLPEGVRVMKRETLLNLGDMQEPPVEPQQTEERPQALDPSFSCTRTSTGQHGTLSATTTRSDGAALGVAMTGVDVRSRKTHEGDKGQMVFVVGFQGPDDPCNPHNWSFWKRIYCTIMIAAIGFIVGFASSIDSSALAHAAPEFGVSEVVESLATGETPFTIIPSNSCKRLSYM
jgi:hypothetical protein